MGKKLARQKSLENKPQMRFRNRIVGLRYVKASEIESNDLNFREHPSEQRHSMTAMLEEVGMMGVLVARIEGEKLILVDGHLRKEIAGDDEVPVLVTDLSEIEARKALAAYDAIGSLAEIDQSTLNELLMEIDFDSHDLTGLTDSMRELEKLTDEIDKESGLDEGNVIPEMELKPNEHYDYVIVLANNRHDWNRLSTLLGLDKVRQEGTKKVGLGRGVSARKLIDLIEAGKTAKD